MRVAICADVDDVAGLVPKTFAAAEYLMIINGDTNVMEKVYSREDERNIGFAEHVVEDDCEVLICGSMDKEAFEIVAGAGVTRLDGSTKKVQRAYDYMKRGRLENIRDYVGGPGAGHTHDYSCECGENEAEPEAAEPVFDAVISSAGLSSRMGDFKPLMELGGVKNILREIDTYRSAGIRHITVVDGHRREELEAAVREQWQEDVVSFVVNPDYASTGMLESARIGLAAACSGTENACTDSEVSGHGMKSAEEENKAEKADGIFFGPVDVPLFTKFTLESLEDRFTLGSEDVYIPECEGRGGHPLLIRGTSVQKLMQGDSREGLKSVLAQEGMAVIRVDVPDPGCTMDADTPEEFVRLQQEMEQRQKPEEERCRLLWDWAGMEEERRAHCRKVAEIADEICSACIQAGNGKKLHPARIHSAALLHDVLKMMDRHDVRGQEFLEELGMPEVGALIGTHSDLPKELRGSINDHLIVYLADKLVSGDQRIPLMQRFEEKRKKFAGNKLALAGVEKRQAAAVEAWETALKAGWEDTVV